MAQTNRTAGDKHHQRFHVIAAQPAGSSLTTKSPTSVWPAGASGVNCRARRSAFLPGGNEPITKAQRRSSNLADEFAKDLAPTLAFAAAGAVLFL
jgi:hypothetical protein